MAEIERRQIERVTLDSWNDRAAVQLAGRPIPLDVDYPDGYEERLVESLLRAGITLEIEERPSALEPLLYYLPFAAFWIWLARRLPRRPAKETPESVYSALRASPQRARNWTSSTTWTRSRPRRMWTRMTYSPSAPRSSPELFFSEDRRRTVCRQRCGSSREVRLR